MAIFYSALSMFVVDTDSPWIDVEYYTRDTAITPRYGAIVVGKSLTSATKPTSYLDVIAPVASVGTHRSGRISTGLTIGGGTARLYVINGGLSGFIAAQAQRCWIADGAALTIQSEGASAATVGVEGWGSLKFGASSTGAVGTGLGYKATAGVINGGEWATRRTEHRARVARHAPGAAGLIVALSLHTNEVTAAEVDATNAEVATAQWCTDMQADFPTTRLLWVTLCRRTENALSAAVRAAEAAACLAAGVDTIDGLTLGSQALAAGDMDPDVIHPNNSGHAKIAAAIGGYITDESITGRCVIVSNSIGNGSGTWASGPDSGQALIAASEGCAALLRAAR